MKKTETVAIIGPVVWGGVWGHGPELARYLAGHLKVHYFDPVVPSNASAPSFENRGAYPVFDGVQVHRRRSGLATGILYGLLMELRNLGIAMRPGTNSLVTYYPVGSFLALLWCRLTGKKSLLVYADYPDILGHPLARWLASKFGVKAAAWLATAGSVATSRMLYEDLLRFTGRCHLVPNGVDLSSLAPGPGPQALRKDRPGGSSFTAGFVGYFGQWVDLDLLAEAASLRPRVRFILVGDGPCAGGIKKAAEQLPNLELTGAVDHETVFQKIQEMDVGLIPFKVNQVTNRVSPVKLFEYWAKGIPVLATGCEELRRTAQDSGRALDFFSTAEELTCQIDKLSRSPELRRQASEDSLRAVRQYDWQVLGARFLALLTAAGPA